MLKRKHLVLIILGALGLALGFERHWTHLKHERLLAALKSGRESAGLRAVGSDWYLAGITAEEVTWCYSVASGGGVAKKCAYHDGAPLWEEDHIGTSRPFVSADGEATDYEIITIHYDYASKVGYVRLITDDQALIKMNEESGGEKGLAVNEAYALAQRLDARMRKK